VAWFWEASTGSSCLTTDLSSLLPVSCAESGWNFCIAYLRADQLAMALLLGPAEKLDHLLSKSTSSS
jgi:hypothetical protein